MKHGSIQEPFIVGLLGARQCARHWVVQVLGSSKCEVLMWGKFLDCLKDRREDEEELWDWECWWGRLHAGILKVLRATWATERSWGCILRAVPNPRRMWSGQWHELMCLKISLWPRWRKDSWRQEWTQGEQTSERRLWTRVGAIRGKTWRQFPCIALSSGQRCWPKKLHERVVIYKDTIKKLLRTLVPIDCPISMIYPFPIEY